jgi:lysophospholipase L1-like esterase
MSSNKLLLVILFLSIALLVSLFLAYKAYRRSRVFEGFFSALLLDPYQLEAFPTDVNQGQVNDSDQKTVVFFGDSRAAHWPFPDIQGNYLFLNRGIEAQSSVLAAGRWAHHVAPLEPDILVVQVGVNDLRLVAEYPARRETIVENSKANIQQIVSDSVELGTTVILTTIFPLGRPPFDRRGGGAAESVTMAVDEVNAYLSSLAGEKVIILDSGSILAGDNGQVRPEYSDDYLHINEAGYEALNQELSRILNKPRRLD